MYEDTLVRTLQRAIDQQKVQQGLLGRLKSPDLADAAQLTAMRRATGLVKQLLAEVEGNVAERVLEPGPFYRVFPRPPVMMNMAGSPPMVLVHDFKRRFTNLFAWNHEWSLCFMEYLLFISFDSMLVNFPASAFCAYIISKTLLLIRARQGQNNISRKSLVDSRFLL